MTTTSDHNHPVETFLKQLQDFVASSNSQDVLHIVKENSKLRSENEALQTTNEQNLKTLAKLQQRLEDQDLQRSRVNFENEMKEMEKQLDGSAKSITELQQKLKSRDNDINSFKEQSKDEGARLIVAIEAKNLAEKELSSLQAIVDAQAESINRFDRFTFKMTQTPQETLCVVLPMVSKFYSREYSHQELQSIFQSVYSVTERFFGNDLDETVFADHGRWAVMRKKQPIPMPLSNSPAAKQMRVAAVLGICAQLLSKYIFQPTYLLNDNSLSNLIVEISEVDPDTELYLRSVLLPIHPNKQEKNAKARIGHVVANVVQYAGPMLSEESEEEFRSSFTNVCKTICEKWMDFQKLEAQVESTFEADDEDDWSLLPPPGQETQTQSITSIEHIKAIVWPAFDISKGQDVELLMQGFVLDETQMQAAKDEVAISQSNGTHRTRQNIRRNRALSVSVGNENGDTNGASVSPEDQNGLESS
ncbi:mei5 protein [Ilyonectria robusta]